MKIEQLQFIDEWNRINSQDGFNPVQAGLVLAFGSKNKISDPTAYRYLRSLYPQAYIISASTAGEIACDRVWDDTIISTAFCFENTQIKCTSVNFKDFNDSYEASRHLVTRFPHKELSYVLVISDGNLINGSELVAGLRNHLPTDVIVTGGLAGDGDKFTETMVGMNDKIEPGMVVAVAFYGKNLQVGYGSLAGMEAFGPERVITKSKQNILYEIDGENALALYKKYLGNYTKQLPGAALLFPLAIISESDPLVRTILSINEESQSMTFAGNMPEGSRVRMMKVSLTKLLGSANHSAAVAMNAFEENTGPEFSLLISCVGRKLVLKQRVDEEVEAARNIFSSGTLMAGFYSYGEISPYSNDARCELYNQTMTITTFSEKK